MASPDGVNRNESDSGYAMVAAVAAMGLFAILALNGLAMGRGAVAGASATIEHARLVAAADAATAVAVHGLGLLETAQRWQPTGETHTIDFNGMTASITVEDETAKIPLNFVQVSRIRRLFELAGVPIARLDRIIADFLRLRGDPVRSFPAMLLGLVRSTLLREKYGVSRLDPAVAVAAVSEFFLRGAAR